MDPNANLREQLELARAILTAIDGGDSDLDAISTDADRLAELVLDLDSWLVKGGFLPAAWGRKR